VNDLHAGSRCSVRNSGDGIRLGARFRVEQVKITDILTWGYFGKALRDATSIYYFKITTKFVDVVGDNVNVRVSPPHRPCCVVAVCSGGGAAEGGAGAVTAHSGGVLLKVVLVWLLRSLVAVEGGAGVVPVRSGSY
jgi:hypothetical protein